MIRLAEGVKLWLGTSAVGNDNTGYLLASRPTHALHQAVLLVNVADI